MKVKDQEHHHQIMKKTILSAFVNVHKLKFNIGFL